MQTHEYKNVQGSQDNIAKIANHHANQGWRVISVWKSVYNEGTTLVMMLERPLADTSTMSRDLANNNI